MAPRVSVIICAYTVDRWDDLVAAVDSVHRQEPPADELVLVIDHNDELEQRARRQFPGALVVANAGARGLSGARNTGVAKSTGDVLVFLDDDASAEPGWLRELVTAFGSPDVWGAGGAAEPRWPDRRPSWFPPEFDWVVGCSFVGQAGYPDGAVGAHAALPRIRNPLGCNMAFRREVFDIAGEFSSEVGRVGKLPYGCEETELCIRLAQARPDAAVVAVPRARVRHRVTPERTTWRYFRRRCWAEGVSKARVSRLVGASDGLASERGYAGRVLPRAVARGLRETVHGDRDGARRALAILAGLILTVAGFGRGSI